MEKNIGGMDFTFNGVLSIPCLGLPISSLDNCIMEVAKEFQAPVPGLRVVILMKPYDRLVFRIIKGETAIWQGMSTRIIRAGGNWFILSFEWENGAGSAWINGYPALMKDAASSSIKIGMGDPPNRSSIWEVASQEKRYLRKETSLRRYEKPEEDPYSTKKSRKDLIEELREYNAILSDGISNISQGKLHSWRSLAQTVRTLIVDYGKASSSKPFLPYVAGLWDLPLNVYCFGPLKEESHPLTDSLFYAFNDGLISAFPSNLRQSEIDLQVWLGFKCVTLPNAGKRAGTQKFETYTNNELLKKIADQEAAHGASGAFSVSKILKVRPTYGSDPKIDKLTAWLVAVSKVVLHLGCRVADNAETRLSDK